MPPRSINAIKSAFRPSKDTLIEISGRHFRLTVDAGRGGEITRLELFDGSTWNRVVGGDGQTFPQLRIQSGKSEFSLAGDSHARIKRFEAKPDRITFQVTGVPRTATGRASAWRVTLGYEIYAEGAVFVDLDCVSSKARPSLTGASMALTIDRHVIGSARYRDVVFSRPRYAAVPSARVVYGVNPEKSFTNEIEAMVEDKQGLAGHVTCARVGKQGRFVWSLAECGRRQRSATRYHNRLALGLGAASTGKPQTNVIGQRIYHWINYLDTEATAGWYPTSEVIDRMVSHKATMLILHQHWMRQGGNNGYPHADYHVARDDKALRAMVKYAHRCGLRVGFYMRGVERYGLDAGFFERYLRRNFDGLYVDWAGPQATSHHERRLPVEPETGDRHFSPDGSVLPARAYFLHTRRLRETVGEKGFLICHMGSLNGGILATLALDGYLPGETGADHKAFADRDLAVFKGMQGGVTCTPWTLDSAAFRTPEAMAKMAAWGFYPHVGMGIQRRPGEPLFTLDPDDPQFAFPLAYWNILSAIDVERAMVFNLPSHNVVAARCNRRNLNCLVYTEAGRASGSPRYLVLLANTGRTALKSASVELHCDVLGMSGEYQVARVDPRTGRVVPRGTTTGRLAAGAVPAWGIKGFVLTNDG